MWGTTGIGINVKRAQQRLGQAALNTWDIVMRPELVGRLKDCGVHMLDAPEDIVPGVLNYLGLNPDSKRNEDLTRAGDALFRIRGNIQKFHSSEYINALANGDICLAVGYSGDVLQARDRAKEAGQGVEIAYSIPKEGALMWFDQMAIPADAPHPDNAHAFLDYLMEPEVIAKISNKIGYANGNLASREFLESRVRDDPAVYPPEDVLRALPPDTAESPEYIRAASRAWTRVKTGQ
jgi:putrescine transport system substrate-binding protein